MAASSQLLTRQYIDILYCDIAIAIYNNLIICLNKVDYFFVQNRQKSKIVKNQKLSKKN